MCSKEQNQTFDLIEPKTKTIQLAEENGDSEGSSSVQFHCDMWWQKEPLKLINDEEQHEFSLSTTNILNFITY